MFWRKTDYASIPSDARERLGQIVEAHLDDCDEPTQRVVTAIAGLLARIAYADGQYRAEEEQHIREELGRIEGLRAAGVDAICELLSDEIAHIALLGDHDWTRDLCELTTRELRLEVLDVLVELAVADHALSQDEVTQLRRITKALNLVQADYNAIQAKHRDKITSLR